MPDDEALLATALHAAWRALRDDASREAHARADGMIEAGEVLGCLTAEQAELWRRRTRTCPGHDDEHGRAWCAFCGQGPFCDEACSCHEEGAPDAR